MKSMIPSFFVQRSAWLMLAVVMSLVVACADETAKTSKGGGGAQANCNPATDPNCPQGTNSGVTDANAVVAAMMAECGVAAGTSNDAVVFQQNMMGVPIVENQSMPFLGMIPIVNILTAGGNINVQVTPKLSISSKIASGTNQITFDVASNSPVGSMVADGKVKEFERTTSTVGIPSAERMALSQSSPEWNGILCVVAPTKSITMVSGEGKTVKVTFDPPLPQSISPKAMPSRYQKELPTARTFTNIKTKVESSTDSRVGSGTAFTGNVRIEPVPAMLSVPTRGVNVQAAVAYKITLSGFGTDDQMAAMGLVREQTFFIDTNMHLFRALVAVSSSDPKTGTAIFLGQ